MLNIDNIYLIINVPLKIVIQAYHSFINRYLNAGIMSKVGLQKSQIYQEYLFDHMFICSNKKPLDLQQFKLCKDKSKDIMNKSLFNNTGGQVTHQELNQRLNWNFSIYSYNLIYNAILRN